MAIRSYLLYLSFLSLTFASSTDPHSKAVDTPGTSNDGKYWIYGHGIKAAFIEYGASISNLYIVDKTGVELDIVVGFDTATDYSIDPICILISEGVPGRYANRIKNSLDL